MKNIIVYLCIGIIYLVSIHKTAFSECDILLLKEAEKKYKIGKFDEMISLIAPCLENGFGYEEKIEAFKLLSLAYLAQDSIELAEQQIQQLLAINSQFKPEVFDSYLFKQLIKKFKHTESRTYVTSVSKKAEDIRFAPATVMVVTHNDIVQRGYIDLEQLLSDLPGFDLARTFSTTSTHIYQRGYRSNHTERTLFLIDGIEENGLWANLVYWARQYPITNIERVEVIYGPASTMYGANALVGVINVITKDQATIHKNRTIGARANVAYGSYNTKSVDVTIAGKVDKISFSANVRRVTSDEADVSKYKEFDFNPDDYDDINYKKILSVTENANDFVRNNKIEDSDKYFKINRNGNGDTVSATLTDIGAAKARNLDKQALKEQLNGKKIAYSNVSKDWFFYGKLKISDLTFGFEFWKHEQGSTNLFNDNNQPGAENGSVWIPKQTAFYLKYQTKLSNKLHVMNFAQYRITELDDGTRFSDLNNYSNSHLKAVDLLSETMPYWDRYYSHLYSKQFRNEMKSIYNYSSNLDIIFGFEVKSSSVQGDYIKTKSDSASVVDVGKGPDFPGGNNFSSTDIGTYLQGTYRYSDWWRLTLGGRYDYNKIRVNGGYGSVFTYRVANVFTPGDFIIKLIVARAFQNASNWAKYGTIAVRKANNPALETEDVRNVDVSFAYQINESAIVDLVLYKAVYDGVIGAVEVPYEGGTTLQNQAIGQVNIHGIQASFVYKYKNYSAYTNMTFTTPQSIIVEDGKRTDKFDRMADIAYNRFNAGVNAQFFKNLNLNLRMNYTSKRAVGQGTTAPKNPGTFPSTVLFNTAVAYKNLIKGFNMQLICNNIFDVEYFDPGVRTADGKSYSYRLPQKGRHFFFRIMYDL